MSGAERAMDGTAPAGMPGDTEARRDALRHVLWIGGAPDAGKTSVAAELAGRHGLQRYHMDRAEHDHIARMDPARQTHLAAFVAMSMDERWVLCAPEEMAAGVIADAAERIDLVIEDLLAMPPRPPILAEGPWLLPEVVAPLMSGPRQGTWLVPTEAFKRASAARRDKPASRHHTSDPERAARNWLARDLLLDAHIRATARALALTIVEVDGSRSVQEMTDLVEAHVGPLLDAASR